MTIQEAGLTTRSQNQAIQYLMAALFPISYFSSPISITATNSHPPFIQKTFEPSIVRKLKPSHKEITCKATIEQNLSSKDGQNTSQNKFDRRDVLVGLGGAYGVSNLLSDPFAFAAPISAPDVTKSVAAKLPTSRKSASKKVAYEDSVGVAQAAELNKKLIPKSGFPLVLDRIISTEVSRPKKSRSKKEKEDEEEILVIDKIEFDPEKSVKFDVYINDEDEAIKPENSEFAGSFVNVPHNHKHGKMKTCLRLGLTDLLEDLEAEGDDSVVVTLVPKDGKGLVTIGGVKVDFTKD